MQQVLLLTFTWVNQIMFNERVDHYKCHYLSNILVWAIRILISFSFYSPESYSCRLSWFTPNETACHTSTFHSLQSVTIGIKREVTNRHTLAMQLFGMKKGRMKRPQTCVWSRQGPSTNLSLGQLPRCRRCCCRCQTRHPTPAGSSCSRLCPASTVTKCSCELTVGELAEICCSSFNNFFSFHAADAVLFVIHFYIFDLSFFHSLWLLPPYPPTHPCPLLVIPRW